MAEGTRERLLEVGLKQMRSVGYGAAGMKELLDEAGIPKGSFYHYFPSKEAFGKAVLESYAAGELARWQRIVVEGKGAPLKRLRRYFEDLIAIYGPQNKISGCLMGGMSLEIADHSDTIQAALKQAFGGWRLGLASLLEEAMERGDLARSAKPDELAGLLLDAYEGALLRAKGERSNAPLDNFLKLAFGTLLVKS